MTTTIDPPPARQPRPVASVRVLTGKRVQVAVEDEGLRELMGTHAGVMYKRDLRAVSEVFTDEMGAWVRVAEELDWYAWDSTLDGPGKAPVCPRAVAYRAELVWLD